MFLLGGHCFLQGDKSGSKLSASRGVVKHYWVLNAPFFTQKGQVDKGVFALIAA